MAKNRSTIKATLRGDEYTFKAPNNKQWVRFVEKIRNQNTHTAQRELVQTSCTSHESGEIIQALNRAPLAIAAISDAIEELALGDVMCETGEDYTVSVALDNASFTLIGPDVDKWESFQREVTKDNSRLHEEMTKFVLTLVDADDKDEIKSAFMKFPASVGVVFDAVSEIAGASVDIVVKKD